MSEKKYPIKWEYKSHSYQIADTGDYDGYWEITNGKDSLITKEDYEDIEKDLQAVVDVLNNTYANFTVDRTTEAALESEKQWLKIELDQARQQQPRGAVWVKASERLPGWGKQVKWRYAGKEPDRLGTPRTMLNTYASSFENWQWLDESPAEQPVVDTLSDDQFPDLSSATPEQKAETINGLVELCAKNVLKMFYAFGLKTHIECTVVNNPTNETFDFIFRKRTAEQPGREVERSAVFVPCTEDDPDCCGGYTSNDGRSLCYVKEVLVPLSSFKQPTAAKLEPGLIFHSTITPINSYEVIEVFDKTNEFKVKVTRECEVNKTTCFEVWRIDGFKKYYELGVYYIKKEAKP